MRSKVLLRSVLVGVVALAASVVGPGAQAAPAPETSSAAVAASAHDHADHAGHADHKLGEGHGITAEEFEALVAKGPQGGDLGAQAWPVPTDRAYHLTSSCSGAAGVIGQGAAAWANLNQTSGSDTPVECRNSYISDCGGGGNIVGCNWGQGQRIALFLGGVNDDALLAAHEFGHDWYGHSSYQCAGWSSPAHVMAPSICNFGGEGAKQGPVRID
ncbi:hypothetical protein O7599_19025 [Streptomyces sp. WMMC500]|uniref:hypothetical protein n=1 Tax=Streptomyces sp. WMMC500 TaxID=3015154 RepID=UPI00248CD4D4|nr:hypothetical protein [Streptomyces sp. WMMC500]WBB57779.1 hypothetical protein O7599_19025 [Streptomyces sp. WMMC500]